MARELAILVTARNMASGVLRDVRGDIRGIQGEARRAVQNTARNLSIAGVAAAGALTIQVKAGLESLAELETMQAQTAAVLESTGHAAGVTAEQVRRLAEEYEALTAVDDKAIQNAENLLLTFQNITDEGFEPALAAILDMNAALGGDEDSLANVARQVGRALNDPVKATRLLRSLGVTLTETQQDQIDTALEMNDAFAAQSVILGILEEKFSGSAAARADTFAGKMKLLGDAVEDAQMALAVAFLPVLEKVADKLQTFLSDPRTIDRIEEFGEGLADGFDSALQIIEKIPWDAVGSTFELMGKGARVVLDMFTSLPPWVQTAVLTGWGLNKLTGGALGNIAGSLIGGLRGGTPANPIFTREVGLPGGGPGGAGGRGGINPLLLGAAAVGGGVAIGAAIGGPMYGAAVDPARGALESRVDELASSEDAAAIQHAIDVLDNNLDTWTTKPPQLRSIMQPTIDQLRAQRQELASRLSALQSAASRQSGQVARLTGQAQIQSGLLSRVANKNFSPTIRVNVTPHISINNWSRVQTSAQITRTTHSALGGGI